MRGGLSGNLHSISAIRYCIILQYESYEKSEISGDETVKFVLASSLFNSMLRN